MGVSDPLDLIRGLDVSGVVGSSRLEVNTHIHLPPNFSAFGSVGEAVEMAGREGVSVVGVSNYYDYEVYRGFGEAARRGGVFPVFGLEVICLLPELRERGVKINDPGNPGKMYLCGKGITRFLKRTAEGERLLGKVRGNDGARMERVVGAMEAVFAERGFATGLTAEKVVEGVVRKCGCGRESVVLQERHVAQAFQEALFGLVPEQQRGEGFAKLLGVEIKSPNDAVAVQNDLRSHLMKAGKPAFVEETFVSFEEALGMVVALGGYGCYPILADGAKPVCPFEADVEKLGRELKGRGIFAAELIPGRNEVGVVERYARGLRGMGIAVTGGTEHNTPELIGMEPVCKGGVAVPGGVREIFWEGACVAAGHQYLGARGEAGFVGGDIEGMAALGAKVIAAYRKKQV